MPKYQLTSEDRRKGGKATAQKPAPADCSHCHFHGYKTWMQHIGHLGLDALAEKNPEYMLTVRKKLRASNRQNGRPPHNSDNSPNW